jgi:murein DD-endopeptidase MepM/ murein hydrolase activator NlpD
VRVRILISLLAILIVGFLGVRFLQRKNPAPLIARIESTGPSLPTISSSPAPSASPSPSPSPPVLEQPSPAQTPDLGDSFVGTLNLIIPVEGVRAEQLLDTFSDARSEGRSHDAIDIPAPAGTPVLAAADGDIVKLFQSERGGTTIYQTSADKKLIFYYAHLQGYAPSLREGQQVRQGEVIAYVGDTGNAGIGNFHLHFSIAVVADPKRYWEGTNINPYPLLRR